MSITAPSGRIRGADLHPHKCNAGRRQHCLSILEQMRVLKVEHYNP